jgi:2,3-bisphosphoglycerate-independent phosphoglycerate mutase
MNKKVALIILDGWGIGTNPAVSAIAQAKTPFIDSLYLQYPHSTLQASGLAVGLPEGQMGNSEVGHTNIGAGRIVYQDLVRINKEIQDQTLQHNPTLTNAIQYANKNQKPIHLIGLLSDGGVHAHIKHLQELCTILQKQTTSHTYIHAFTDGRDTAPQGARQYLADLQQHLKTTPNVQIASIIGRYYAMDRDNRWERIKLAYDLLVKGHGTPSQNLNQSLEQSYTQGITDEFILPIIATDNQQKPIATIQQGDVVLFFNFRNDRGRQLTQALTQQDFPEQQMEKLSLHYLTMTTYDDKFHNINVLFQKDNLDQTLGEVIANAGKTQIRIAETEKYPHVTFFFSGGREEPFKNEKRILCPSPKVATYDLQPQMSAQQITNKIIVELDQQQTDFICLNFANPDMVGHTGNFQAAIIACQTIDHCTQQVVTTALNNQYTCLIIADHGNSDIMQNPDGSPHTAHTTNLVPCILVDNQYHPKLSNGKLGDLAPTILQLMGIEMPKLMTGHSLIQ